MEGSNLKFANHARKFEDCSVSEDAAFGLDFQASFELDPTLIEVMALPNIFTPEVSEKVIARIQSLTSQSQPKWGKMSVAQMLAHCSVTYEMVYETKHKKPNAFVRLMLKMFVKKIVVTETPYKHDSRTAPAFLITDSREFEQEKDRLIAFIRKTQQLGEASFEGKESLSFGPLNKTEWNNMFYKHLDHHLNQFGA